MIRWRYLVVIVSLALAFVLGAGGKNLVFTNNYRYFFSEDNPQLLEFESLQDTYTKNYNVYIMLEPQDGIVFSQEFLAALKELTEQSWQVPYSIRVDSVTNFQHTYAEEDDLIVIDLVDDVENLSSQDLNYIKQVALGEPLLVHRLISKSATAAGVNITIELPGKNQITEGPEVVAFTRNMIAEFEQSHPNINVYTTGIVMMNNAFPEASQNDVFGESMFSFQTNASKVAPTYIVSHLHHWGFPLLDCQLPSPHLSSLGAQTISRTDYINIITPLCDQEQSDFKWKLETVV